MHDKHLHIISFDVPFPANYGGVIDVFYKLIALKKVGIKIHLHCFDYGRGAAQQLEDYCEEVSYYPRKNAFSINFSTKPYIVNSRKSDALIDNLLKDEYPILFEGLHTCYYLNDKRLKNRVKIYRESNIEHHYYYHLFRSEKNPGRKLFFIIESLRLLNFQKNFKYADLMLVVSQSDTDYLLEQFPDKNVVYLPSFHPNDDFSVVPGKGDYIFYHGKLSVTENYKAAEYLINNIFNKSQHKLIIAGMDPPEHLVKLCKLHENVQLIQNPEDAQMFSLIQNAQANILITFQATGLKLKLLNTLYKGRFCVVNPDMVQGTGLGELCIVADSDAEMRNVIDGVFSKTLYVSEVENRLKLLMQNYSNTKNAQKLVALVYRT